MSTSTAQSPVSAHATDAPLTLAEPPGQQLGLRDALGLWGNLGISLLLPVAAAFVVLPGSPFGSTLLAVVVGAVIGSVLLGLGAAAGARERVPAMVLMRGLLGRRVSYLPTAFNLLQCIGWATFEIFVIATAASQVLDAPMWPFLLGAGALATLMALRPLGSVRVLARYAVWVALAGVVYLFVRVLVQPLPEFETAGAVSFWAAVDIVIALPVSWFPLAADYTRHVRSGRSAFTGAAVGYGAATIAFFMLGVLALSAYGTGGFDVIDALLTVPLGAAAIGVLVLVEVDEAFANVYSTAISAQNISPRMDRRILALIVGAIATTLAFTIDIVGYEPFLFLIGAVFVPLVGVFVVAYFLMPSGRLGGGGGNGVPPGRLGGGGGNGVPPGRLGGGGGNGVPSGRLGGNGVRPGRGGWDTSHDAPARPWLLVPWLAGFVAYQLTTPTFFSGTFSGWTEWWTARQTELGIPTGMSASLVSLAVAAVLTALVSLPALLRRRPAVEPQ